MCYIFVLINLLTYKYMEKINIRGAINSLKVEGGALKFPKPLYRPSIIRSIAGQITSDSGKKFNVSASLNEIIVKRVM